MNRRIRYAKELLQTEEYSVSDVAMLSGFNDTAYFAREFKKAVGLSPSSYRKEIK
jgi:AraC-like DNA-binding protein